jgi:hypothetical protein
LSNEERFPDSGRRYYNRTLTGDFPGHTKQKLREIKSAMSK